MSYLDLATCLFFKKKSGDNMEIYTNMLYLKMLSNKSYCVFYHFFQTCFHHTFLSFLKWAYLTADFIHYKESTHETWSYITDTKFIRLPWRFVAGLGKFRKCRNVRFLFRVRLELRQEATPIVKHLISRAHLLTADRPRP